MSPLYALALWISCLAAIVAAVPTFEHFTSWDSNMGDLIPGASYIQAIGRQDAGVRHIRHLNVHVEGQSITLPLTHPIDPSHTLNKGFPGNLTAVTNDRRPEWFYIRQNQLYQVVNSTTIYAVNLKNIGIPDYPLQLVSSNKREGNRYGVWRWQGSMLFYEEGKLSNGGLYYECTLKDGHPGIFTFLKKLVVLWINACTNLISPFQCQTTC